MIGYDIDGVLTFMETPPEKGVIISGRSFEEENETRNLLKEKGLGDWELHLAHVKIIEKNYETSSRHKVEWIKKLGITKFYEDEEKQADYIKKECPGVKLVLVNPPSRTLLKNSLEVQEKFYRGEYKEALSFNFDSSGDFTYFVFNHPDAKTFFPKDDYEIIVLMSGGMDSYIGYLYAKKKFKKVIALYVDYGYPYAQIEKQVILNLQIPDLVPFIDYSYLTKNQKAGEKYWGEIFPGRNWIMGVIASDYIKSRGEIWMLAVGGEVKKQWGDKSEYFFKTGSQILSRATGKTINIETPFKNATKGQMVKWYLQEGFSKDKLLQTVSCHYLEKFGDKPCGRCMGCAHRFVGMNWNDIVEEYKNDVRAYAKEIYQHELDNPFSEFSEQRKREIEKAIL